MSRTRICEWSVHEILNFNVIDARESASESEGGDSAREREILAGGSIEPSAYPRFATLAECKFG